MFQFDLYSCSCFTAEEVLEELDSWFQLELADYIMIDRNGKDFAEIERGEWARGLGVTKS
jgi:hypothetical protein